MSITYKLIILTVLLFSSLADARVSALQSGYSSLLASTRNTILSRNLAVNTQGSCTGSAGQVVADVVADGEINIMVVFGYMDVSGQNFSGIENSLYTNGSVLDLDAKNALVSFLKGSCQSGLQACGFRGNRTLTKRVPNLFGGGRLRVNIVVDSPAVSASNAHNIASRNQARSSARVRNNFLAGLQQFDAVIYMGHARSGAGPDFDPPILTSSGRVNYGAYSRQDYSDMIGVLAGAREPASVIGILACYSTSHFRGGIQAQAPDSAIVTAGSLFDFNDIVPTGYAMIEAIVSQKCGRDFTRLVKARPNSSNHLSVSF
jgi:hypothetical protein